MSLGWYLPASEACVPTARSRSSVAVQVGDRKRGWCVSGRDRSGRAEAAVPDTEPDESALESLLATMRSRRASPLRSASAIRSSRDGPRSRQATPGEAARTVSEQDRDAPVLLPDGQREVDVAVTVQVGRNDLRGTAAEPPRVAGREAARAVPDQHPDLVRVAVCHGEIRLAVGVQIRRLDLGRTVAGGDGRAGGRVEPTRTVSEQHREVIGPLVPDGEIHVAVAVEVRGCRGSWEDGRPQVRRSARTKDQRRLPHPRAPGKALPGLRGCRCGEALMTFRTYASGVANVSARGRKLHAAQVRPLQARRLRPSRTQLAVVDVHAQRVALDELALQQPQRGGSRRGAGALA